MFRLPENVLQLLHNYFTTHPQIIKVLVYGSRAMNRATPGSDVDLAIVTNSADDISGKVQADLENLPTPYLFDVVDYQHITHKPLREHIDRVGQVLYQKK
jgi:predicted nucleotidyltransferase